MKPNTPNIAEIRQMVAAATPGPWKVYRDKALGETLIGTAYDHPQLKGPNSIVGHVFSAQGEYVYIRDNDADLIAKAPETITALCDEVERQREGWEVIANLPIGMHPSEIREFGKRMLKGEAPYKLG